MTGLCQQLTLMQRASGALALDGIEMAAIAAQQRPQLGHGHWRGTAIPDQVLGQVSQMQNCLALQIMSGKLRHPAPAYPDDILQQAVAVVGKATATRRICGAVADILQNNG
jgi:hypothetical protein